MKKLIYLLPLLLIGCKDPFGDTYNHKVYHYNENEKLIYNCMKLHDIYKDSILRLSIKYNNNGKESDRLTANKLIDSVNKYSEIGLYLINHTEYPR
jgi:hypothetical protein